MGLAASQARLLTITSRKSDAQYESMRLSHQKLALSRSLTEISNQYQNSLNQTKLYYDYYGVGATDTQLTYNVMMLPSTMNNYTPIMLTNRSNRIVLSSPYAEAARRAGIPEEGLGCCTSGLIRDAFIDELSRQGVINSVQRAQILGIPYNQTAGVGSSNLITEVPVEASYSDLMDYLGECYLSDEDCGSYQNDSCSTWNNVVALHSMLEYGRSGQIVNQEDYTIISENQNGGNNAYWTSTKYSAKMSDISLKDLINGTVESQDGLTGHQILLSYKIPWNNGANEYSNCRNTWEQTIQYEQQLIPWVQNVIAKLKESIMDYVGEDTAIRIACDNADDFINSTIWNNPTQPEIAQWSSSTNNYWVTGTLQNYNIHHNDDVWTWIPREDYTPYINKNSGRMYFYANADSDSVEHNAYTASFASGTTRDTSSNESWRGVNFGAHWADDTLSLISVYPSETSGSYSDAVGTISLTNFVQAWYSAFLAGLAEYNGNNDLANKLENNVSNSVRKKWRSNIGDEDVQTALQDCTFYSTTVTYNEADAQFASFYDTLLNQICINGWCQNDEVAHDASYLQEMLKSGKMFMFQMQDDNYYYQSNYATNQLIKEMDDESAIAQAEARYQSEKSRINAKEEELDMKMKNLDTEISSLEQEYEAVKKMISNNAQKAFTRYQS